jgi:hypothetical protein
MANGFFLAVKIINTMILNSMDFVPALWPEQHFI